MDDLIAITCFFNPAKYRNKKINFIKFRDNLRKQGVPLLVVECSFRDSEYELSETDADIVVRVQSNSKIWQKERLLNIGIKHIPEQYTKFATLDCDIIFKNEDWATATSYSLDSYYAVQPFETSFRLSKGQKDVPPSDLVASPCTASKTDDQIDGQRVRSFTSVMQENNGKRIGRWLEHGDSGLAWAFRKDVFTEFYDRLIIGSGDWFLAFALFGIHAPIGSTRAMVKEQKRYVRRLGYKMQGKVSFVPGMVVHLWHGERKNRNYSQRNRIVIDHNFDLEKDLWLNETECWEVSPRIGSVIEKYFESRKEDG
jgi:hypothetical protein